MQSPNLKNKTNTLVGRENRFKQTAGRKNLGDLAPKFAELNDDVLFGEVWSREDKLSLREHTPNFQRRGIQKG